jgi:hypothetical protein
MVMVVSKINMKSRIILFPSLGLKAKAREAKAREEQTPNKRKHP